MSFDFVSSLISIMRETLENALNGIDGKNLVTDEIEDFLEALRNDEIPDVWTDNAYPTMDNLEGYLKDLQERVNFLKDWLENGPPKSFWVS